MSTDQESVILLHGLARTPWVMKRMAQFLESKKYRVHNLAYPSTHHPIADLANIYLHTSLQHPDIQHADKIHFVTHSLGGIVLRAYLRTHVLPNLARVVMIAPPNQGSEVAEYFLQWRFYQWLFGPAGQELGIGHQSVPKKMGEIAAECGIIAGNRSLTPIFSRLFTGANDGKVSVANTQLNNMKDFLIVPSSHTLIVRNTNVMHQTHHFLQQGKFAK